MPTPQQIQIEESKIMTTCIIFEPSSHISLSFLHCIQLYADVMCRVVLFKLRLVFTLSVGNFQRTVYCLNFSIFQLFILLLFLDTRDDPF